MKPSVLATLFLISAALTACGSANDAADEAPRDSDREAAFGPLVDTLDDAEQVQDLALEQKKKMDEALGTMEGEEKTPDA